MDNWNESWTVTKTTEGSWIFDSLGISKGFVLWNSVMHREAVGGSGGGSSVDDKNA